MGLSFVAALRFAYNWSPDVFISALYSCIGTISKPFRSVDELLTTWLAILGMTTLALLHALCPLFGGSTVVEDADFLLLYIAI